MAADPAQVRGVIVDFLGRVGKAADELADTTALYGEGLELDSLEAAELSAMLEDTFGTDPFSSAEQLPETVGDVIAFYEVAATA
jgi:acyl carrier protein